MATIETRALDQIDRLTAEPRSLVRMWDDVTPVIQDTVPHLEYPCWFTLDPASLLITSHYNPFMPELPSEGVALEYYEPDVVSLTGVVRSGQQVTTMHDATGGDPSSSRRWQTNSAMGGDQELIAPLRTHDGGVWGVVSLYRGPGEPRFDDREKRFMARVAVPLAEGARRALLFGEATDPDSPTAPGLLVLTRDWRVESSTPGTEQWLDDLPDAGGSSLPAAVLAVAGQALRSAEGDHSGEVAMARVLSRSGRWVVLHGAALRSTRDVRVAVIVEPAHPARLTELLMSAYALTGREREVTRLVLQGASTAEIAEDLFVSPLTVQQHLKSVFAKTGVRSRRDLVGKIFFNYYEPRLRDNEARVPASRPLRGGPKEASRT